MALWQTIACWFRTRSRKRAWKPFARRRDHRGCQNRPQARGIPQNHWRLPRPGRPLPNQGDPRSVRRGQKPQGHRPRRRGRGQHRPHRRHRPRRGGDEHPQRQHHFHRRARLHPDAFAGPQHPAGPRLDDRRQVGPQVASRASNSTANASPSSAWAASAPSSPNAPRHSA